MLVKEDVSTKRQEVIEDKFSKLGITQDMYPKCENPHIFARRFKKCSILKEVPNRTSDTSFPTPHGF